MESDVLLYKVLGHIQSSKYIREARFSGNGSYCDTTEYRISDRLTVVEIHNGCESMEVWVDGVEVGRIPKDETMAAIRQHKSELISAKIASL